MLRLKIIVAGLAAGVLCHIMQGMAAYFFYDRFYLANPDLIRDSTHLVGVYYLALNLIVGLIISYLASHLKSVWNQAEWVVGFKSGIIIWVASSPVFVIKRQIIFDLSNWLLLEIFFDLIIYSIIGAVAGFLSGPGIVEKRKGIS